MKKVLKKAVIVMAGCVVSMLVTSCHIGTSDDMVVEKTEAVAPAAMHTIRGVIFDQDGRPLSDATVTMNDRPVTVVGNTFSCTSLSDGNYVIEVSKTGYKGGDGAVQAYNIVTGYKDVNGIRIPVSQELEGIYYLIKEQEATIKVGNMDASDNIVLETSTQNLYGSGKEEDIVGNTQDPQNESLNSEIYVSAEMGGLTTNQINNVNSQLANQLTGSFDVNDLNFTLTNLTSLSDAIGMSKTRNTRAIIIAGEELPDMNTFFTGVNLDATVNGIPVVVDFSFIPNFYIDVTFDMPDDVKNYIKIYRKLYDTEWTEVTSATSGDGIAYVDYSQSNMIVVRLYRLESQSFSIGVKIDKTDEQMVADEFSYGPYANNTSSSMLFTSIPYQAMSPGIVLTNLTDGSMVDYLRKIVMRYYKTRAIKEATRVDNNYDLNPPYSLVTGGQLFLKGYQMKAVSVYKIYDGNSSFRAEEYRDVFVYPYAIVPTYDTTPTQHIGGSND